MIRLLVVLGFVGLLFFALQQRTPIEAAPVVSRPFTVYRSGDFCVFVGNYGTNANIFAIDASRSQRCE